MFEEIMMWLSIVGAGVIIYLIVCFFKAFTETVFEMIKEIFWSLVSKRVLEEIKYGVREQLATIEMNKRRRNKKNG